MCINPRVRIMAAAALADLLAFPDVAALLHICRSTLRTWINSGRFPQPVRYSRRCVRWRRDDVARFVAEAEADAAKRTKAQAHNPCRNCHAGPVSRPRGLCWSCFYRPGVRELYPSTSKFARRGPGNFCGAGAMPTPTDALPGSEAKVRVLIARAAAGQALWHEDDAQDAG